MTWSWTRAQVTIYIDLYIDFFFFSYSIHIAMHTTYTLTTVEYSKFFFARSGDVYLDLFYLFVYFTKKYMNIQKSYTVSIYLPCPLATTRWTDVRRLTSQCQAHRAHVGVLHGFSMTETGSPEVHSLLFWGIQSHFLPRITARDTMGQKQLKQILLIGRF